MEMHERTPGTASPAKETEEAQGTKARAMAGRALAVFLLIMALLTWGNKMLQEMTVAVVTAVATQRGALEKQFNATGTLEAAVSVPVVIEDAARVLSIYVAEGGRVANGDPLLLLDYTDAVEASEEALLAAREAADSKRRAVDWAVADMPQTTLARFLELQQSVDAYAGEVQAALLAYESAVAAYGDGDANALAAEKNLERARYYYDTEKRRMDRDATVRDYLTKAAELEKAEAELEKAEAEHEALLTGLEAAQGRWLRTVSAEVSGSVTACGVTVGAMVSSNSAAMVLSDMTGGLRLVVTVDEDQAAEMEVGDMASVTVGETVYDCPINSIVASVERQGKYDVYFLLPGEAGSPGVRADMRLRKRTQSYDLMIPLSALRSDSDGDFVYVVEQSSGSLGARMTVRRVDVYVLDTDNTRAALQSGVTGRDMIVSRSDRDIGDGDRVRLEE